MNGTKYFDEFISVVEKGKEGILSDGSFIQHTNLAYTGGYGSTLLNNAEKLVYVSAGTDWEVASEKLDVLWNFIWDGIRPLYADGAMFDMVGGRGIARPTASDLKTGRVILEAVALLSNRSVARQAAKFCEISGTGRHRCNGQRDLFHRQKRRSDQCNSGYFI